MHLLKELERLGKVVHGDDVGNHLSSQAISQSRSIKRRSVLCIPVLYITSNLSQPTKESQATAGCLSALLTSHATVDCLWGYAYIECFILVGQCRGDV